MLCILNNINVTITHLLLGILFIFENIDLYILKSSLDIYIFVNIIILD